MSNYLSISEKISQTIAENNMIKQNDNIVIAVSGGADSMTLLHSLVVLSNRYNLNLIVAHLNHGIRGDEAKRDECFVKDYCLKMGIRCEIKHCDIIALAKKATIGVEECGRKERYRFFESLAKKYNAKISTGHTLSDRVETTLFNITRGTGLKGIISILPVRDNIIRPLIDITRSQTEEYCKINGVPFITDSSNLSRDYSRNLIRLDVVPKLKDINPKLEEAVYRLIRTSQEDNLYIEKEAKKVYIRAKSATGYDVEALNNVDTAVLSRVIKLILNEQNIDLKTIEVVKDVVKCKVSAINIRGNKKLYVKDGLLRLDNLSEKKQKHQHECYEFRVGHIDTKFDKIICVKVTNREEFDKIVKSNKNALKNAVDYDIIGKECFFRNRLPSDVFRFSDTMSKKVKKLFNERKIPLKLREELFLLANGGNVLWIDGIGVSSIAKVKEKTEKIALIEIKEK